MIMCKCWLNMLIVIAGKWNDCIRTHISWGV